MVKYGWKALKPTKHTTTPSDPQQNIYQTYIRSPDFKSFLKNLMDLELNKLVNYFLLIPLQYLSFQLQYDISQITSPWERDTTQKCHPCYNKQSPESLCLDLSHSGPVMRSNKASFYVYPRVQTESWSFQTFLDKCLYHYHSKFYGWLLQERCSFLLDKVNVQVTFPTLIRLTQPCKVNMQAPVNYWWFITEELTVTRWWQRNLVYINCTLTRGNNC